MANKNLFITKDLFIKEYVDRRLTDAEFAYELNCSVGTIKNKRKLYNIPPNLGINLLNRRFDKLIVIKEAGRNRWQQILWECKCDCGNIKIIHGRNLLNKDTKSCGCLKHRLGENNPKWEGCGILSGSFWCHVKYGAKKRNLDFEITKQDAYELLEKQNFKCHFSGMDILNFASLDRIDSSKGYILGNITWVHKDVNILKWEFPVKYFLDICYLIKTKPFISNVIEIFPKHPYWKGCGNISAKYWGSIKRASKSKKRGREIFFDVDINYAWDLFVKQEGKCAISGVPLFFGKSYKESSSRTASLDRIDSSLDYTKDNIWWVHKNINKMKWTFSKDYLFLLCNQIVNHSNHSLKQNEIEELWQNI